MEIIIKFIFGVTVVAFGLNFFALIGYVTFKIKNIIYKKCRINILGMLFPPEDSLTYSDYIFVGLFVIGNILFLIGLTYVICQLGNNIYSLF